MALNHQTINEERGARRAADLRRRFALVSDVSFNRPSFGLHPASPRRSWAAGGSRRAQINDVLIWSTLAAIMVFFGFVLF